MDATETAWARLPLRLALFQVGTRARVMTRDEAGVTPSMRLFRFVGEMTLRGAVKAKPVPAASGACASHLRRYARSQRRLTQRW